MLRLNFIKSVGYIAVDGDEFVNDEGYDVTIGLHGCTAKGVNKSSRYTESGDHIKSFAFRSNNGTQPVQDDFPVVVEFRCGDENISEASFFTWHLYGGDYAIKSWKPDYDKLLEQQNEYDKQQAIESKESKMSEFTYGQKIYIKDNTEHDFTFGCYHTDGESILFLFDTGYGRADISKVSATPFKTELEIAKEKQIECILNKYTGDENQKEYLKDILEWMQLNGELAEITLPSKDK